LNDSAKAKVRKKTWAGYESLMRIWAIPRLGRVKLVDLTAQHIQGLYTGQLDAGLSPRTVELTHSVLHSALKQAYRWNLIPSNPADKVSPPRPGRHEIQTLSGEQVRVLLESLDDPLRRALYTLAVTTGLRQGEQLGLFWSDVDLERGELSVRRTLQWQKKEGLVLDEVKTPRSRRSVALSDVAVAALKRWRTEQKSQRLQAGPAWCPPYGELVFTRPDGRPLEGVSVTNRFKADLARAELPVLTYRELRHTAATLLLADDKHPKVVQEMLGHATIAVTMDTYSHVLPHMQRDAAGTFDRLLKQANGS
jgi:integrase